MSEIKDIKYSGVTTTPDDYESADGDLFVGYNVRQDKGSLTALPSPKTLGTFTLRPQTVYLHKTSSGTNFIVQNGDEDNHRVWWSSGGAAGTFPTAVSATTATTLSQGTVVSSFASVGNTLIALSGTAIHYYLWSDGAYTLLGDRVPDLGISFGLRGYPRLYTVSESNGSTFYVGKFVNRLTLTDDERTTATDAVMPYLNSFIASQTTNKGRFCFPFFVRYALHLYDGSLVCHSAPILMVPSTDGPMVLCKNVNHGSNSHKWSFDCDIMLIAAALNYQVLSEAQITELQRWKDIVKSVDIYVSAPIYTYDQSGKVRGSSRAGISSNKFVGCLAATANRGDSTTVREGSTVGNVTFPSDLYGEWSFDQIYAMYFDGNRNVPTDYLLLPYKNAGTSGRTSTRDTTASVSTEDDSTYNTLRSTSLFYKVVTISIDDLTTTRTDIDIADDYLQSLTSRDAMTDDYLTHDKLMATTAYTYNQRLNLSGVRRELYGGYDPASMFCYVSGGINYVEGDDHKITVTANPKSEDISVFVYIREQGGEYVVNNMGELGLPWGSQSTSVVTVSGTTTSSRADTTGNDGEEDYTTQGDTNTTVAASSYDRRSWGCFLFYPNSNAYKMVLYDGAAGTKPYEVTLLPHDYLNGAYALLPFNTQRIGAVDNFEGNYVEGGDIVPALNKVYTSVVGNPFYFPATGIVTVGTGDIITIATATKPLSEGQFGQFPLYAMTTEGVWALAVSDEGTVSARHPVTRDVCLSAKSVCQLDQEVLFASARGIMLLSGSESRCISEALDNTEPLATSTLQQLAVSFANNAIEVPSVPEVTFTDYIADCRIIYNYTDQNVVVFNAAYSYAYVYDLKTSTWSYMSSRLSDAINAYPQALALDQDNGIVDLAAGDGTDTDILLVTRPLKLGQPDVLKTVQAVLQRGQTAGSALSQLLYGSRDLVNYHPIASSQTTRLRCLAGTPFKYFVLVVKGSLAKGAHLSGATLQYVQRYTNRLR